MNDAVKTAAIMTLALAAGPAGWAAVTAQAFAINLAITMTSQALLNKNDSGFSAKAKGRSVMFRSPAAPRQICYGESVVSGPLVFAANSGTDNKYLHLVIPVAGHQVEAIDDVYFNDKPASDFDQYAKIHSVRIRINDGVSTHITLDGVAFNGADIANLISLVNADPKYSATGGNYYYDVGDSSYTGSEIFIEATSPGVEFVTGGNGSAKILTTGFVAYKVNKHLGAPDQIADADLVAAVPEWTINHRLRGVAYVHVQLGFSTEAWSTGLPNIKLKIRGKNDCYDPRDLTSKYTTNWALCVNDYLRYKYGFNSDASEVHQDSLIAAANISDEPVELFPLIFQPRYEVNGAFTLDESPIDVLTNLRSAGAGMCIYQFGQWRIHAGAPRVIESTGLNESDLRGSLGYQPKPNRQNLFNAVSGTFIDKDKNYQETNFPPVTNSTYQAEDGYEQIFQDVQLPFTNDTYAAQRLAKINLEYHRQPITVNFPCKIKGMRYAVGDVLPLSISALGWIDKPFQVIDWTLSDLGGPLLVLKEYASTMWDWNFGMATVVDPAPDTSLTSPRHVIPPENLQLFSGNGQLLKSSDGSVLSYILADWETKDGYALVDEVQYRKSGYSSWISAGTTKNQELLIGPVDDGVDYDVSVRTLNTLQVPSLWRDVLNYTVIGKTAPPPDPSGLSVNILSDSTRQFVITASLPVDFGGYLIRARAGTFTTWDELSVANGGLALHSDPIVSSPWETAQISSGTFTLGVKLIDTSGNESVNAIITPVTFLTAPSQLELAGSGVNIANYKYSVFNDVRPTDMMVFPGLITYGYSTTYKYLGSHSLKITMGVAP